MKLSALRAPLVALGLLTLLTGVVYPLLVTGIGQLAFPNQANGSLVIDAAGAVRGSALIGQGFTRPEYFWSRPSYAGQGWDGMASSGSNLGPLSPDLKSAVATRVAALREIDSSTNGPVPVDLVTASGSGLDPHITPAAARYQIARVARARGLTPARVEVFVLEHTRGRWLGILGEPVVNVLALNRALDAMSAESP